MLYPAAGKWFGIDNPLRELRGDQAGTTMEI